MPFREIRPLGSKEVKYRRSRGDDASLTRCVDAESSRMGPQSMARMTCTTIRLLFSVFVSSSLLSVE